MILEILSGFSNSSTVITENWKAKGVSATDELHLDDSKTSYAMSTVNVLKSLDSSTTFNSSITSLCSVAP